MSADPRDGLKPTLPEDDIGASDAVGRPARTRFRADIEGLRTVAVLAVVLFHADVPGIGGGYIGVDVFFVISGFLITGLLWRDVNTAGTVRLGRFYGARARRLLPASAAVAIITMISTAVLLPPLQAIPIFDDGLASALYVGNIWLTLAKADYFSPDTPSPFLHYWSLGVEEQFYLVWPILLIGAAWLIRRRGQRAGTGARSSQKPYLLVLVLVGVTSFAASLVLTYVLPMVAFFMMPTRAWQLAIGGVVALTVPQWYRLPPLLATIAGWAGLGVILLTCTWLLRMCLCSGRSPIRAQTYRTACRLTSMTWRPVRRHARRRSTTLASRLKPPRSQPVAGNTPTSQPCSAPPPVARSSWATP